MSSPDFRLACTVRAKESEDLLASMKLAWTPRHALPAVVGAACGGSWLLRWLEAIIAV
jgi:hypothetical protein